MFEKLILVKDGLIDALISLSKSPGLCAFYFIFFFFIFYGFIIVFTNSLFCVHRSKTACRKIMKEYNFWQKAMLIPHKTYCLHAKKICIKTVNYMYIHAVFFAIGLIIMIFEYILFEKMTVSVFVLIIQ